VEAAVEASAPGSGERQQADSAPTAESGLNDGRILVTGGAGFIGSALVWALNQRGRTDILVTDFLEPAKRWNGVVPLDSGGGNKRRNLAALKFADYVEADVFRARIQSDPGAFGRFGTVFHLGACSSTTERNEAYLQDNNFGCTRELAEWSLARGTRFIYASSAATYGDGAAGMDDRDENLARLYPLNLYGWSKQRFDLHAQKEGYLHRIVGLKYFNVFGPDEDHKGDMRSLVHKAYEQILATGKVSLFKSYRPEFKDGEQQRDFLYVKDAVEMTLHFAGRATTAGGLYNLGSGQASTWLALTSAIFAALDRAPDIEFIEMPAVLRDKYQYFTQADIAKLRSTGYDRPVTPLADAVRDYVRNYLVPGRRLGE
jgi:ADP-L-glycero-D-manno-heptose 6-epimerase